VEHFQERGGVGARRRVAGRVGLNDGDLDVGLAARAALLLLAGSLLALQLALGALAVGGLHALVVAVELLADRRALGFGSGAGGVALGRRANGLALGAVLLLAVVLGAADAADGALAVHGALCALGLLATHLALGLCADGVADSRALRVIALPLASRVALFSGHEGNAQSNQSNQESTHFYRNCSTKDFVSSVHSMQHREQMGEDNCCPCNA